MKISVLMPSRGRPMQMAAALNSFKSQESGNNEVVYGIACDADDEATIGTCEMLANRMPLCRHVLPRAPSLGGRVNAIAENMPADVYCSAADDMLVMTKGWDQCIAEAWEKNPAGVWWWRPFYPQPALWAIVSERWRAAAGQIFTDYFPYWFDDIWLLELWVMATEQPIEYIAAQAGDHPRATMRMRDLSFWHDFWHHTRPQRLKHAKDIAAKLGLREPIAADIIATVIGRPVQDFVDTIPVIEQRQGELAPPTLEYIKAKSRAQEIMGQPQDIVKVREDVLRMVAPLIAEYDRAMAPQPTGAVAP